jgi:hypothetical protein
MRTLTLSNAAVECVGLLCFPKTPGLNLGSEPGYPDGNLSSFS